VGGNTGKKAGFTASSSYNAYLTQEFSSAQTGVFSVQWDIYVDSILNLGSYPDRAGIMMIGSDLDGSGGPNRNDAERFVFLAFWKDGGATSGTAQLVWMDTFNIFYTIATVNLDQWHTIKVVVNVPAGKYDVYLDGKYIATVDACTKLSSVTHISFAQWNDGAGAFYVDNVFSPAIDRYKLTVNTVGSGSVTKTPGESTYTPGALVSLKANPASGWYFDRWSGDASGNANPTTIKMDSDKTVTAIFTQSYTLTVNVIGGGSVSKNPNQTSYTPGTIVTLTATPAQGWYFSGWSGDLTGSDNLATIIMDSSKVVTATFTQPQYTLTVNVDGSGVVIKNPNQPTYTEGIVVTLTAIPATGWSFSGWSGDLSGSNNPANITMTSNKVVNATFTEDRYTLTVNVNPEGGGSVTKTPNQTTYTYGTVVQLTAIPEPGYVFSHWTDDLSGSTNPESITMTGNKVVTAVFVWTQTNWWNPAWKYRRTITIDHTKVSGELTDFPVLIEIVDSSLAGKAQSYGDDFVFTDSNSMKLDHQIELYDSATGHLIAWVKVPYLSPTTDTVLYMYYGNPNCENQQNPTEVWDANYKLVMHLNENMGIHYDSTINGNNGTPYGSLVQGAKGYIGSCVEFNGGYIQLPRVCTTETQFTFSAWIYPRSGARYIISEWWSYQGAFLQVYGNNKIELYVNGIIVAKSITLNRWYYVVATFDGTTARLYINDGSPTSASASNPIWPSQNMYIGDRSDHVRKFYGFIDEVRVSNIARSVAWLITEYNNQLNPSAFYTIGPEEQYAGSSGNSLQAGNTNNTQNQQGINFTYLSPITLLATIPAIFNLPKRRKPKNK
jgi:hypothetical protein